jgi:hypothetical protein
MLKIIFGVFIALHGLVHMLYFGQSARYFELQPGMIWPDGTWVFSKLLGNGSVRFLASTLLVIAAVGFLAGAAGIFAQKAWARPLVVGSAVFSAVIFLFFWNGALRNLDNQGWVGILIDAAILAALLLFRWPNIAPGNN